MVTAIAALMARFDEDQSPAGVAMSRAEIGDDDRVGVGADERGRAVSERERELGWRVRG